MSITSKQLSNLVSCFEPKDNSLPSSLTIYKAAKTVYHLQANNLTKGTVVTDANARVEAVETVETVETVTTHIIALFQNMIQTFPTSYLHDILKDIHSAFASLVTSLRSQHHSFHRGAYTKAEATEMETERNEYNEQLQKCIAGVRVLYVLHRDQHVAKSASFYDEILLTDLCFVYECLKSKEEGKKEEKTEMMHVLLATLSSLLLNLLRLRSDPKFKSKKDELLTSIMEGVQILGGDSTCLGDLQSWQEKQQGGRVSTLSEYVHQSFSSEDGAQKNYLIRMLSTASRSSDGKVSLAHDATTTTTTTPPPSASISSKNTTAHKEGTAQNSSTMSAVDRLVQQIKTLCPHLGDGYIEVALACHGHDLERTTAALLEGDFDPSTLHPRLQVLDKTLPARKKESKTRYDTMGTTTMVEGGSSFLLGDKEEEEAKQIQKARLREMEKEAENQAFLLSSALQGEYDDDYDDQYDGFDDGGGIGGVDGGMYDVDLDAIRAYNKAAKEVEADRLFWGDNRNLNRQAKVQTTKNANKIDNDDDNRGDEGEDDDKKYRGPDKGKKGRIIGPDGKYLPHPKHRKAGKRGTKKDDGKSEELNEKQKGSADDTKMNKIQRRRKNDNKAKIANHHRKERALKKTR